MIGGRGRDGTLRATGILRLLLHSNLPYGVNAPVAIVHLLTVGRGTRARRVNQMSGRPAAETVLPGPGPALVVAAGFQPASRAASLPPFAFGPNVSDTGRPGACRDSAARQMSRLVSLRQE